MIDRHTERRQIERSLHESGGVLLTGPVGAGKSHLLAWAGQHAVSTGWQVERVLATQSLADVPFGALTHLLPPPRVGFHSNDAQYDLIAHLRTLSPDGHLLLLVDDGPLLDQMSAAVVSQVVTLGHATVVITARSGEPLPVAITELLGADRLSTLAIEPLGFADCVCLAESLAGQRLSTESAQWVWQTTAGNPLFITALVADALERAGTDALPEMAELAGQPMGSSVSDAINVRLARLTNAQRTHLETVAVAGSTSLAALERLDDPAAIASLEDRRLVTIHRSGRRTEVRLAHPLIGEALVATMGFAQRRQRLLAVAGDIERGGMRRAGDALRMAIALDEAGAPIDVDVATKAAETAHERGSPVLAERFARMAFDEAPTVVRGVLVGYAMMYQGRPDMADALLTTLEPMIASDEERTLVANALALNAMHGLVDPQKGQEIVERHLQLVTGPWRYELTGALLGVYMYQGRIRDVVDILDEVMKADDVPLRAQLATLIAGLIPLYLSGRNIEAVAYGRLLLDQFGAYSGGVPTLRVQASMELAEAMAWNGDIAGGQLLTDDLRSEALLSGNHSSLTIITIVRGLIDCIAGEHVAAGKALADLGPLAGSAYAPWIPYIYARLAHAALRNGDQTEGLKSLQLMSGSEHPRLRLHDLAAGRARAELLQLRGDSRSAVLQLRGVRDEAFQVGNVIEALFGSVRLLALTTDADDLAQCGVAAAQLTGAIGSTLCQCFDAIGRDDASAAAEFTQRLIDARHLMFARDAADAIDRRCASSGLAAMHRLRTTLAREMHDSVQPTPVGSPRPQRLTAREQEVADMAADGSSDAAIAAALGLSVRTVNAHVRSIFVKLGITKRSELRR
jgi:DNA-binding CsgD family transcriptional regulator